MRSSLAQTPARGRLSASRIVLPMKRLAMRAQHELGLRVEQLWPRPDAVALEGAQHDRRCRGGRDAECQQGHETSRSRGVVGRLRARDALDGALAEVLGVLGQLLLHRVGEEGRDLGATGRHGAEGEADRRAAQPRLPGARPVVAVHRRAADVHDLERVSDAGAPRPRAPHRRRRARPRRRRRRCRRRARGCRASVAADPRSGRCR